jgi:AcrR family transcriptional regulator
VGVTRGAPYRHFPDKDSLLTTIAAEALDRLADQVQAVRADPRVPPADTLHRALATLMTVGRRQPHLYRLMFASPVGDPAAIHAAVQAGDRAMDEFLAIVGDLVGAQHAHRFAALLLTSAHGITDMEVSGHLSEDKWHITAEELVSTLGVHDRQTGPKRLATELTTRPLGLRARGDGEREDPSPRPARPDPQDHHHAGRRLRTCVAVRRLGPRRPDRARDPRHHPDGPVSTTLHQ